MKKFFVIMLTLTMFISYGGVAYAAEQIQEIDALSAEKDLNEAGYSETDVEDVVYSEEELNYVDSTIENEDMHMNSLLEFNEETGKISVTATLQDEYGNDLEKSFDVEILELYDEENFKATFTDQESGEEYTYDSTELKASVWPAVGVVIGFIAKSGLKQAIKKWSKSIVSSMIRATPALAKEAAKDLGYSATNYTSHGQKVFKRGKKVKAKVYNGRQRWT